MGNKGSGKSDAGLSTGRMWLFTGAAVIVILIAAVVIGGIVRGKGGAPEAMPVEVASAPPPPEAAAPAQPASPTASSVPASDALVPVEAVKPAVVDKRPALQLDKLAGTLSVNSAAAPAGGRLNLEHTCYRLGVSPPVSWSGAPSGTKAFVLIVEERQKGEAPFVKWLVYNIPSGRKGLPQGLPQVEAFEGGLRQGRNDHGSTGYTGPCIPQGKIPYAVRLFALDKELPPGTRASFEDLIPLMNGHIIDAATYEFEHYLNQ